MEQMHKLFGEYFLSDLYNLKPSQLVMYVTRYCADCKRAKAFLELHHIDYLQVGLEGNDEASRFVMSVNRGNRSVPTMVFPDGSILVEPSSQTLEQKFSIP
jgi:mycoredoxin